MALTKVYLDPKGVMEPDFAYFYLRDLSRGGRLEERGYRKFQVCGDGPEKGKVVLECEEADAPEVHRQTREYLSRSMEKFKMPYGL